MKELTAKTTIVFQNIKRYLWQGSLISLSLKLSIIYFLIKVLYIFGSNLSKKFLLTISCSTLKENVSLLAVKIYPVRHEITGGPKKTPLKFKILFFNANWMKQAFFLIWQFRKFHLKILRNSSRNYIFYKPLETNWRYKFIFHTVRTSFCTWPMQCKVFFAIFPIVYHCIALFVT